MIIALALAGAALVLYSGVVSSLARQWASDDNFSHGFFVVPLALLFVWERRGALARAPHRPSLIGLAVIVGSLLLFLAGITASELFLTRISLVALVAGTTLFVWGRDQLRILAFPIAFLLLMIPPPAILFNQVAFPLQLLASRAGEAAISLAGIPVLREGNVLQLPTRTLEIVEACSGIRSLVSLITLAVVLGYFTRRPVWDRAVLVVAAVPIAILANAARVAGTGLASEWISPEAADGFFHAFSGWIIFVFAFIALIGVQRLLTRGAPSGRRAVIRAPRTIEA